MLTRRPQNTPRVLSSEERRAIQAESEKKGEYGGGVVVKKGNI